MQRRLLALTGFMFVVTPTYAAEDLDALQALGQSQFRLLSEDLGAALSYKALTPGEPLGVTGFDIGIEVTNTKLEHPEVFNSATTSSEEISDLPLPKLHVHKGLPFGFDVGAFYTEINNISLVGAEVHYAIVKGNTALPAIGIRATYTDLSGVDQLGMETIGGELTISKGFAMFTPYAGAGQVRVTSTPQGNAAAPVPAGAGLREEKFTLDKYFVGVNANFGLLNLAVEGDQTGDATTYGLKIGLRF